MANIIIYGLLCLLVGFFIWRAVVSARKMPPPELRGIVETKPKRPFNYAKWSAYWVGMIIGGIALFLWINQSPYKPGDLWKETTYVSGREVSSRIRSGLDLDAGRTVAALI